MHTVGLFKMRLLKLGYKLPFINKHILEYDMGREMIVRGAKDKQFELENCSKAYYPIVYDKFSKINKRVGAILKRAEKGLVLKTRVIFVKKVQPKLRSILSTRKQLHEKMSLHTFV